VDAHDFELLFEGVAVNPITISQQILRCAVERKGFDDLLRGPFCSGMRRYVDVDDASSDPPSDGGGLQLISATSSLASNCISLLPD
jgi:hypothetical protein